MRTAALLGAPLLALLPHLTPAQSERASYQIRRQSLNGGAARASSTNDALDGTIGPPDAGASMASASYQVRGGFHRAGSATPVHDAVVATGFEAP